MISRRNLIKGGAVVGGTVWVAPAIESFVSRASAASVLHACCECYDSTPVFLAAAADDYTDAGCRLACDLATPGVSSGFFVRYTAVKSFIAEGSTEPQPGCHAPDGTYLKPLEPTAGLTCPPGGTLSALVPPVSCDTGTWP
jgi:hypothetical protein